ncbi:MAG: FAD-dependent oxidoreductase [Gemmatimonadota bacterium]|nr:FAD-dependent oxidoreductase [Gemmatimonadota bacterium]
MRSDSGATESLWMGTIDAPSFPALGDDARTHVCVIGAGIAGMSAAYMLARAGKAVVVIDDGPIGGGETGRTTAHLSNALDDRYAKLKKLFGEQGARHAAESHSTAIQRIEAIVDLEGIDCDFERVDGFLFLAPGDKRALLTDELEASHVAGLTDTGLFERAPLDAFDTGVTLRFPRQGQFHVMKYLSGLAAAITRDGGRIYCGTRATSVEDGTPAKVTTADGHTILADDVIVATNSPVNDWMVMHTKQAPYRTYAIAVRVPKGSVPRLLLWDTGDPYHYVRIHPADKHDAQKHQADHDFLIVGGEDHKTGQAEDTDERFNRLERWTRERFPMAGEVAYRWSGQVLEPVDGLAFIGKNPGSDEHIYIATGDSGHGIAHGTIAGILLTDLITGVDNPWTVIYDPSRISFRSAPDYARENINVAEQYSAWLTAGDVGNPDEIPNDSGAVVRRGMRKIAVYRDANGYVTECSAVCTHLYCIVDWNDTEKTWDCPCHGSRFDRYGKVVNGPAIQDLQPVAEETRTDTFRATDGSTAPITPSR